MNLSTQPAIPSEPSPPVGDRRLETIILVTLVAVQFTSIIDFMIVMPLGPQLMASLGIDGERFGWIISSYTFAAGLAGLLAAPFLDRFDRKYAFLVLYVGFIAGTLACGLAPGFWLLLAARTLAGAFGGLLGGQAMAIVADVFPENRRGQATGALMSAFAVASVAGVPLGIAIGNRYGWQVPFLVLAVLSLPLLGLATWAMPPIRGHLQPDRRRSLGNIAENLSNPNHLWAFLLVSLLMFGAFMVIPFISTFYVANVGVTEGQLPIIFIVGGMVTLVGSPVIGRLVDRFGKLTMYRVLLPVSALMVLVITHLPPVGIIWASLATSLLMLTNTGRMVAAMALITGCVEPSRRGGFMSANSSFQHIAGGLGTALGGVLVLVQPGQPFLHYERAGYVAVAATLASLLVVGKLRLLPVQTPVTVEQSLAAAAEAQMDAGEALTLVE